MTDEPELPGIPPNEPRRDLAEFFTRMADAPESELLSWWEWCEEGGDWSGCNRINRELRRRARAAK